MSDDDPIYSSDPDVARDEREKIMAFVFDRVAKDRAAKQAATDAALKDQKSPVMIGGADSGGGISSA